MFGERRGKTTKVKMWTMSSHEEIYRLHKTNATGYLVGTGGAVAAEMLIGGEVSWKGIVIPEQLPTESFLRRLRTKGVDVKDEIIRL